MAGKYEFKLISLGDLEIVDFNPNEMNKTQMDHLRKTIKERGFMQPLIVTPKELECKDTSDKFSLTQKYIVIDGAHRLEIFKELKRPTIPCYIVPDKKPIDIKIDLINLNKIRGEFNQKKYAKLLESLDADIGEEKLKELLNLEEEELKTYLNLAKGIDESPKKKEVKFTISDIECPKCGHRGPKADFKIKKGDKD